MFTRRKRFAISLALAILLATPPVTLAHDATAAISDWSVLKTVAPGGKLVVKMKNGKSVKGKLISVSDTTLSLSNRDKPAEINRDDVLSIHEMRGMTAKKATLIGAGVGAGTGAVLGSTTRASAGSFLIINRPQAAAATSIVGAGLGALIGFIMGKSRHKRTIIYQAKQP